MPQGDEKHKLIYEELVNILGPDYVEDDPAIMVAYSRDWSTPFYPPFDSTKKEMEFVVLPGSTEDVQQIVKLANRYKFPFSVASTGLFMSEVYALKPYWCYIDLKRMNRLEIDAKNMYAIVEPYVTTAQLSAEAMKVGLFHGCPGSSSQGSALANAIYTNTHWTSWREGNDRCLLGMEWVLPNGEVIRTGSLAIPGAGYFWGEGPGPDSRNLFRGRVGTMGAFGIATRVAIKCLPWPGPRVFPTEGVQPEKESVLPPERFKTYIVSFSTLEKSIEVVREIGRAEIGTAVLKFAPIDVVIWAAKSREEFWTKWENEYWTKIKDSGHLVVVGLWGFASEKQLEYEKKVFKQIVQDFGGEFAPDEEHQWLESCLTPNCVRDTHRCRFMRIGGYLPYANMTADSLSDVLRSGPLAREVAEKYTPPYGYVGVSQVKFWPREFGRHAGTEINLLGEKSEEEAMVHDEMMEAQHRSRGASLIDYEACYKPLHETGVDFCNIHFLIANIKKYLDPNDVANPTRLIDMEAMKKIERGEEWVPIRAHGFI